VARKGNISNLKPFKPGDDERRNLDGRPRKLPELDRLLADCFGDKEMEAVLLSLHRQALKGNVRASEILLDRAYGKPRQTVEQTVKTITPVIINWKPIDDIEDAISTDEETMGSTQPPGE